MNFEIKNRWTSQVMFLCELSAELEGMEYRFQLGFAAKKAAVAKADLSGAYLRGAYLSGADLSGAYLSGADLSGAYLRGAYLSGAYLSGAYLRGAYLSGADLSGADLSGAYLRGAKNIPESWLVVCRDDIWAVLSAAPMEVSGLREKLIAGEVDGSCYEGACACLVGTIANLRGDSYESLPDIKPNSRRPAEQYFTLIRKGDTPENNEAAKNILGWIDTWRARMVAAFGPQVSA